MRRKLLYLSVALLAFGIGSLIAFSFYWKNSVKFVAEDEQFQIKPIEKNVDNKTPSTEFICEDEAINIVWKRLMKNKTFLDDTYINVVKARQIKDCRELFEVKPIQLNDDNVDEFMIVGNYLIFCDSGGDCQTWIVAKINDRYEVVFDSVTGISTTKLYPHNEIELHNTKTYGFRDLEAFIPNGWDADNFGYFKFDGKKYQLKSCYRDFNSAYVYDSDYVEKWLGVKPNECLKRNFF